MLLYTPHTNTYGRSRIILYTAEMDTVSTRGRGSEESAPPNQRQARPAASKALRSGGWAVLRGALEALPAVGIDKCKEMTPQSRLDVLFMCVRTCVGL